MKSLLASALMLSSTLHAQNVGIGTTTPTGPLSFASMVGNKIVLYGDGNSAHYGFGIQGAQLQMYSDAPFANIHFGFGRSSAFTERMRIINAGVDGMMLNGRISLRNGTTPLSLADGPGVWLYKANNTGQLSFMGTQNNQNVGFYGGPDGWGFTYDAINSRVGIGNDNAAFKLDITGRMRIRQGSDGEPGIWLNKSDNTGIAAFIGMQNTNQVGLYGALGAGWGFTLNTANGALSVNGNAGNAGQVLTSNGGGTAAQWKGMANAIPTYTAYAEVYLNTNNVVALNNATINFNVTQNTRVFIWYKVETFQLCVIGPCHTIWQAKSFLDGVEKAAYSIQAVSFAQENYDDSGIGPDMYDVGPGNHSITITAQNKLGNPVAKIWPYVMLMPY